MNEFRLDSERFDNSWTVLIEVKVATEKEPDESFFRNDP